MFCEISRNQRIRNASARSVVVTYKLPMLVPRVRFPACALFAPLPRSPPTTQKYFVPGLNWGPLACEASVITTRPMKLYVQGVGGTARMDCKFAIRVRVVTAPARDQRPTGMGRCGHARQGLWRSW